jgi:hypothetical protein
MAEKPFDPDEVRVCMVIALCLCGAALSMIYRFAG